MSQIHFISDIHFSHQNIIKFCNRPFSNIEEMNEIIVENWNNQVAPDDDVYCLGDVSWKPPVDEHYHIPRLNGNKHLILGNHDRQIKKSNWDSIQDYKRLDVKIGNHKKSIILFHYPIHNWDKQHYGSWHLFGHVHAQLNGMASGKMLDVGLDSTAERLGHKPENYRPISLDEVKEYMDAQEVTSNPFMKFCNNLQE